MTESDVEEFGRKAQRAQYELEQIRGTGFSGHIKVEVDAAGKLLSVRSSDGADIMEAYQQAIVEAEAQAREVSQEVLTDPLAASVRGLLQAHNAQLEADRRTNEEKDSKAWDSFRDDPLGWRR
ncbi:YbaB/EbfC family DNA-binding protein [Mycobacteriaceae bacterium NPDC060252]